MRSLTYHLNTTISEQTLPLIATTSKQSHTLLLTRSTMSANGETVPQGMSEVADLKGKGKGVDQHEITMEDDEEDEDTGEEDEEVRLIGSGMDLQLLVLTLLYSNPNLKKVNYSSLTQHFSQTLRLSELAQQLQCP